MPMKKVRMLVDHQGFRCDDCVEMDAEQAKAWIAAGVSDGNKAAVEYALWQNGGKVIQIDPPPAPIEEAPAPKDPDQADLSSSPAE